MFLHADSEDPNLTGWQMPRLIWVFAGRTCHFVGFVMHRFNYDTSITFSDQQKITNRNFSDYFFNEPQHDKTNKMMCVQQSFWSACASVQYDQSVCCAFDGKLETQGFFMRTGKTLIRLGGCPEADLSLCRVHMPFYAFVMQWLKCDSICHIPNRCSLTLMNMKITLTRWL